MTLNTVQSVSRYVFLLTCLLRGMTQVLFLLQPILQFLLTCLLRGMTTSRFVFRIRLSFLLTCLLRGMTSWSWDHVRWHEFLLTCLLRGMTLFTGLLECPLCISTHMPLARHDGDKLHFPRILAYFYSHASCEA